MTRNTNPPFRADHVGSLLRSKSLTNGFRQYRTGEIDDDEFTAIQDSAIRDAIAMQEDAGLDAITDGEFRRASYWSSFVERVEGLEVREALFTFHDDQGEERGFTAPHVAARVRRSRPIAEHEFLFLRDNTSRTPKITLPSPPSMHFWRLDKGIDESAYPDKTSFFTDLAAVYREEISALAAMGATYIQLDDVPVPMLCDPAVRQRVRDAGMEPNELMNDYLELFNDCVDGRPDDMTIAVHMCRGNYKGRFLSEGGYDAFADEFFNKLNVDAFFLEYDSPRAGDFAPLRHVPPEKLVVLGLISSKAPELEDADDIRRRIDAATEYIPLEQLCLSPQCGFASTVAGNPVDEAIQRAKLQLVVDVAASVWG